MAEEKKEGETSSQINVPVAKHVDHSSPEVLGTFIKKQRLIQEHSWTKTVPYKHWHIYAKPSESIGSIYAPDVYPLRTGTLTKRVVKSQSHLFTVDDGPPRILVERHNEETKRKAAIAAEKKRDDLPENVVNLKDLANSTKALRWKELSIRRKKRIKKGKSDDEVTRNVRCNKNKLCTYV